MAKVEVSASVNPKAVTDVANCVRGVAGVLGGVGVTGVLGEEGVAGVFGVEEQLNIP